MKKKYLILFSLSGFILSLDQFVKTWIHENFVPHQKIELISNVVFLTHTQSTGMAFGILDRVPFHLQNIFFIVVPVFALVLIVLIFIKLKDDQMLTSVALSTILAGAIGNLIDRIQYGHVIDFLEFRFSFLPLPTFNVADISILVGIVIVFLNTVFQVFAGRQNAS